MYLFEKKKKNTSSVIYFATTLIRIVRTANISVFFFCWISVNAYRDENHRRRISRLTNYIIGPAKRTRDFSTNFKIQSNRFVKLSTAFLCFLFFYLKLWSFRRGLRAYCLNEGKTEKRSKWFSTIFRKPLHYFYVIRVAVRCVPRSDYDVNIT